MTWRCTLIQRRLPDYPDGDLSPFWKRQVAAHLEVCPDCRRELEELTQVVRLYQAHPLPDPGPAFWQDFARELHVKLAQVNQTPEPTPWRLRLPHYILGATALAGILVLAVYLGPFTGPSATPQIAHLQEKTQGSETPLPQGEARAQKVTVAAPAPPSPTMAQPAAMAPADKSKAPPVRFAQPEPPPAEEAEYSLAAGRFGAAEGKATRKEGLWPDDDILSWDVDAVVADLSREERENLRKRLESGR
jgi:anti-sigma factor RsiW